MVKIERSFPAPESLAEEAKKVNGKYDKEDVIEWLKLLQREMNILYKQLEKIYKNPDSKTAVRMVQSLLKRESAFAAFKRCYVREHAVEYPELQEYVLLDK